MTYQYSFKDVLSRAERITWRVEDLIGGDKKLDFTRPFLPEVFARTAPLAFLNADEKRVLNQIRGHAYIGLFALVEEFILPFVLDYARPHLSGDDYRTRAYLEFASEEAKHIQLFHRFREAFVAGFPSECALIGPPEAISAHVLAQPPLSVALLTLHLEWMSQRHFTESVKDDGGVDPVFKDLLLHHWMEEHQHAQLDAIMVETLAAGLSQAEIEQGIDGYLALGAFLDEGLKQQVQFDLDAFERATDRVLNADERAEFIAVQHQANRATYIGAGMSHPRVLETVGALSASKRQMIEGLVPTFS